MVSRPQGPDPPTGPLLEQAFTPKDNVPSLSGLVTFADEAIRGVKIGRRLTVKFDGYRIVVRKEGARATLWTRHGTAVRRLPVERALVDGEAVAFRQDGHSDLAALRTKAGAAGASLVAFDLLTLNEEDYRQRPLEDRRGVLSGLIAGIDGLNFSEAIAADGALVFAKACEMGLEGIVSKRAGSRYWSGPSKKWLKSKNPNFAR
jgi:bifunctional non-homologous end joining protein LigD